MSTCSCLKPTDKGRTERASHRARGPGGQGRGEPRPLRHPWEPCRSPEVCPLERRDMGVLDWGRPGLRAENWELGEFCALRLRPPHPHGCLQKGREPPSDSRRRSEGAAGEAEGGSSAAGVAAGCWAAVPPGTGGRRTPEETSRAKGRCASAACGDGTHGGGTDPGTEMTPGGREETRRVDGGRLPAPRERGPAHTPLPRRPRASCGVGRGDRRHPDR